MSEVQKELEAALHYHQAGDLDRAEACYGKILEQHPEDHNALHMLGVLNYQKGQHDRAISLLEKALQYNNSAEVLTHLGSALKAKGNLQIAKDTFIRAIELNPGFALAHFNLGNTYKILDEYDKAIASYKRATEINPLYCDAFHNLATVYEIQRRYQDAKQAYQQAILINPDNAASQFNLAGTLRHLGELDAAVNAYKRTLELNPDNPSAHHLLSALTGQTTEAPPNEYIADLFDGFSKTFDDHLVNKLGYQTPGEIHKAVMSVINRDHTYSTLDLGCGTGLCGPLFIHQASFLAGVDLSPGMIDKAKELNIYHELRVSDIQTYLDATTTNFDIIIAADVFVYIGNLEPTFRQCKNRLEENGIFAFSIEEHNDPDYTLCSTGRYAHSIEYIRKTASATGLIELDFKSLVLRKQEGKPVQGCIFVFKNPDKPKS
ncbi:MAG: tetratricopeptide repeat protein [Gammaproteobacteria bacterium]|nr:tetratricopeptide repeat protein [Gammaproteobacteria bacterium]